MKYFVIVIVFFQFLNFAYSHNPSILCNTSFLRSATASQLTDVLASMRHENEEEQNWIQQMIFSDRDSVIRSALFQVCDEITGDTPLHRAARVGARFDLIEALMQEERRRFVRHSRNPLSRDILRKNAQDQTPFEILKSRLTQELSARYVGDLDTLLELYITQNIAQQDALIN